MNNVTSLSDYRPLPTAATQQSNNVITLQRALQDGVTADQLRAVANWNERRGYDARDRAARMRHRAQAAAVRAVADELEATNGTQLHREAA